MTKEQKNQLLTSIINYFVEYYSDYKKINNDFNEYLNKYYNISGYTYNEFCCIILKKYEDFFDNNTNDIILKNFNSQLNIYLDDMINDKLKEIISV